MRLIIPYTIFILTLLCCSEKSKKRNIFAFDFTDTVRRIEVKRYSNGDSSVEHQIITFAPNDVTVPICNFYYEAMDRRSNKGESYRIYFGKQKVIAYCDSMLKVLGPETLENFNVLQMYSAILKYHQQGFAETIFVSETHYLMNRFRPLIVNPKTGHKPEFYFTIDRKSPEREGMEREFVTQKGDTFGLLWENIWIADFKTDTKR